MSDIKINNITSFSGSNGPVISGITTAEGSFFGLPRGDTAYRGGRGRGVFGGGSPGTQKTIDYITIHTLGNALDFGDLINLTQQYATCASSTRGIFAGGEAPSVTNVIEYITISATGNSFDFGDLTQARRRTQSEGASDSIRGLFFGGYNAAPSSETTIDYITIASKGNASVFGDLTRETESGSACASPTRAIQFGGRSQPVNNEFIDIQYVTIQTLGNALDFGDLTAHGAGDSARRHATAALSSSTRGICAGGRQSPGDVNTIEYITIASLGDGIDFGDMQNATRYPTGTSNGVRGVIAGGTINPAATNTIDYITIATIGNASNFGDLTSARSEPSGLSDSHGGLG